MTTTIHGECHCGNISYELETALPVEDIVARACDCSFCRRHVTKNWSDPNGSARLRVEDSAALSKYQFGFRGIDFFICAICGGYAGAVLDDADGTWATLNLRMSNLDDVKSAAASYGGQSADDMRARRKRMWTPAVVEGG